MVQRIVRVSLEMIANALFIADSEAERSLSPPATAENDVSASDTWTTAASVRPDLGPDGRVLVRAAKRARDLDGPFPCPLWHVLAGFRPTASSPESVELHRQAGAKRLHRRVVHDDGLAPMIRQRVLRCLRTVPSQPRGAILDGGP